ADGPASTRTGGTAGNARGRTDHHAREAGAALIASRTDARVASRLDTQRLERRGLVAEAVRPAHAAGADPMAPATAREVPVQPLRSVRTRRARRSAATRDPPRRQGGRHASTNASAAHAREARE